VKFRDFAFVLRLSKGERLFFTASVDERGFFRNLKPELGRIGKGDAMKRADFRTFYRDAHAVECLSDREKMLIGLTVAMMRLCDP
jgi:O-methyltransferase involved in polyketide biosynthesis